MVKSYKGLLTQYESLPSETKAYLRKMEDLLSDPKKFDIALAFAFMKLEEGHHRALKCGLVRRLKCNSAKVDHALERQYFTREYFQTVFENIIGKPVDPKTLTKLRSAEKIRDKQIHGKNVSDASLRQGISDALQYISELGEIVKIETKKNPFGDLRGLASRTELLDEAKSFWILKGVGLYSRESK